MKTILIRTPYYWGSLLPGGDPKSIRPYNTIQDLVFLRYLQDRLRERGYSLLDAEGHPVADCEWVIFTDAFTLGPRSYPRHWRREKFKHTVGRVIRPYYKREFYRECLEHGRRERLALWNMEPPSVQPHNWDPAFHSLFSVVLTYATDLIDGRQFYQLRLARPLARPRRPRVPFHVKKLLVCVQGNKRSSHPLELYSARRRTIHYFERAYQDAFELYGVGWADATTFWGRVYPGGREDYPSYRGLVTDKAEVFPRYRFGLIYENCVFPGWVSEKIFDCLEADCVPVYLGAPDITDFVCADAFVDARNFKSDDELADYLWSMSEAEYNRYRDAIDVYFESEQYRMFSLEACAETVIRVLGL